MERKIIQVNNREYIEDKRTKRKANTKEVRSRESTLE
jgi:hypothetical protein